jgi:hypothetical protein
MLAIPLGMYHTFRLPKDPNSFVITAPALQLILIPFRTVLIPCRYLSVLKAVTVEHLSRYALLLGPKMRRCLLLPQHWAQEAGDKQTWMELKREWPYDCVLNWKRGKKTIPLQPSTNVRVFYTASSSARYCAFAATFKAMEASFFRRKKILQYPGRCDLMDDIEPEKFVVEENLCVGRSAMSRGSTAMDRRSRRV